MEIILN